MKFFLPLAVFYLSAVNLVSGVQAIMRWTYLSSWPLRMPLAWLVTGKLAWGLVLGLTAWSVWRGQPWHRTLLLTSITLYQVHIWINHILFDTSHYARQVWPFQLSLSLLTLIVVWGYGFWPKKRGT